MDPSIILTDIDRTAGVFPDQIALQVIGDSDNPGYSFRQTRLMSENLSQRLRRDGIAKGDRVVLWGRLGPKWAIAYLGVLFSGAVVVPLDVEYGSAEIAKILDQVGCKLIFTTREKLPLLQEMISERGWSIGLVALDSPAGIDGASGFEEMVRETSESLPPPSLSSEDEAMIFYTSGTTGKPKGVVILHRSLTTSVHGLLQYIPFTPGDNVLGVIPSHHIFASLANVLAPLSKGATVTFLRTLNSTELLKTLQQARITIFPAVPQVFYLLHQKIFEEVGKKPLLVRLIFKGLLSFNSTARRYTGLNAGKYLFGSVHRTFGGRLNILVSAASFFDPKVIRDFHSLGFTVLQGYGLTETFGGGTFTPYSQNELGSVGKPIPGVQLKVVDPDESGVGEIAISGPSVMRGYYQAPEATAEVLRDGWFYTGDLGYANAEGNYYITGRKKEMIVLSSGKKVYPEEVELHYLQSPFIKEMCVLGSTDSSDYTRSERLHAVIIPDFDYLKQQKMVNATAIIRESIEKYSASLPKYKRILTYEIQTEPLPRTTTRKLIRHLVAKQRVKSAADQESAMASRYNFVEGDDILEAMESSQRVLEVLRRESRTEQELHLDLNLELDLGFDSLQRIELIVQIEQMLRIVLGDEVASQCLTVRDLLKAVAQRSSPAEVKSGQPSPSARITWKEIIASTEADEMAEKYVLYHSPLIRAVHFTFLRLVFLLFKLLFRLRVRGLENLPQDRPYLICPNHQSYLDGLLVSTVLPYRTLKYLFTLGFTPFFSGGFKDVIARWGRIVPIDPDTNLARAMRISTVCLKAGYNLLIFPEGSLSCDGDLQLFKKGTAILARELNLPMVPVAIRGSFNAWSKVGDRIRLAPIDICFGQPFSLDDQTLSTANDREQEYALMTQKLREKIADLINSQD